MLPEKQKLFNVDYDMFAPILLRWNHGTNYCITFDRIHSKFDKKDQRGLGLYIRTSSYSPFRKLRDLMIKVNFFDDSQWAKSIKDEVFNI